MKGLMYMMLAIFQIIVKESHSQFNYGRQRGCNYLIEDCYIKFNCINILELNRVENNYPYNCNEGNLIEGRTPIWLNYRIYDNFDENILEENLANSQYAIYIFVLNITFNNYDKVPTIPSLQNLKLLNVSHNEILTAQLYNIYELVSLKEIDFSYNKIRLIDIDENGYVYGGLKKLWLSHNNLLHLPDMTFKSFSDLEFLDLSDNFINNLTLSTFEGINQLKILHLSNNEIVDLNSSLFRFNKLTELYISNNIIKNILFRDFENLNNLEILDLSNNYIVNFDKDVFINLISLRNIDLSGNILTVVDKNTFGTTNIRSINLSANQLTELPIYLFQTKAISFFSIDKNNLKGSLRRGTFEGLKLITELDISYQSITSIEEFAFFGLDSLKELLLNNNIIKSLSNNSFMALRNLVKLDLSFNHITHVDFDKTDLHSLRYFLLGNNHIAQIKKKYFESLQGLHFLDLSRNNISKIDIKSFDTLENVINIFINENPITGNLTAETFKGLDLVPMLNLSYTFLNVIMNASFDEMISLNYLNISHSEVHELQYNTFWNTGNIEILDLSYNVIKEINLNTTALVNLKQFLLNNNKIVILYDNTFQGMPLLNKLLLSHNLIKTLDNETFKHQSHLIYLDLSFNSNMRLNLSILREAKLLETLILSGSISNITLKDYNGTSFTNLEISHSHIQDLRHLGLNKIEKLISLDLSYNNMTQLGNGGFTGLSKINHIDVSYNKINLIEPGVFKDNHMLNSLNISHNNLLALSYGVLHGLISLRILDISYNFISNFEAERFDAVANIAELIADHNRISDISIDEFNNTNIQKLSIGDNPLSCEKVSYLIRASSFVVTSLRHVEDKEENVYGITCNLKHQIYSSNTNVSDKTHADMNYIYNILNEIKDGLQNLNVDKGRSEEGIGKNDYLFNVTQILKTSSLYYVNKITELSNETLKLNEEQKNSNKLLERILKVIVAMNSLNRTLVEPVKSNVTSENFINYINQLRQDFENAMILDREKILAEVESRLLLINNKIQSISTSTLSAVIPKNEKMTFNSESKSSIFVETCVAFILLILVCLVLYKAYKSRFYISRRRSISTRTIADTMDISNV